MKYELVKNWMSTSVLTVSPDTKLPEAHRMMVNEEIRRLPVVDEDGRLCGIVTLGDIRGAQPSPATNLSTWEMTYLLANLTIAEIMTPQPFTVDPEASIGTAARIMLEHRFSGLPVVDDEQKLVGIITESDIFSMVVMHEWGRDDDDDDVPRPEVFAEED